MPDELKESSVKVKTTRINEVLEIVRWYLYREQHNLGGTAEWCNVWGLVQDALGDGDINPQVPVSEMLAYMREQMKNGCRSVFKRPKLDEVEPNISKLTREQLEELYKNEREWRLGFQADAKALLDKEDQQLKNQSDWSKSLYRVIAQRFGISVPSVHGWFNGNGAPHPNMQEVILNALRGNAECEKEITNE